MENTMYIERMNRQQNAYVEAMKCLERSGLTGLHYAAVPAAVSLDHAILLAQQGISVVVSDDGVMPDSTNMEWRDRNNAKVTYLGMNSETIIIQENGNKLKVENHYYVDGVHCCDKHWLDSKTLSIAS